MAGWKLSCQERLLPGETLEEKWDFAQSAGFDGVELLGPGDLAFEARLPELRRAAANGVPMPTVCVQMLHFLGAFDADLREDAIRQLSSQLSVMAELGGRLAMTPASYGMFSRRLPPYEPPRSPEEDRAVLLDGLRRLGEHALSEGVLLCLEPLNRYEDYLVNTLAQARELCEAVGLPSVRVVADTYHMNIEEADPPAALEKVGPMLGHVDWAATYRALMASGYEGWCAFECRLSGPATTALPAAVRVLREVERSAQHG